MEFAAAAPISRHIWKLEYLAVYGRAFMSVPEGELQYGR